MADVIILALDLFYQGRGIYYYPTLSNGITLHRLSSGGSGGSGSSLAVAVSADFLCRTSLHIGGNVRIGVESEPSTVVAQHTGQRFHIHAAGEGHGGEGVAQIVEAHMLLDAGLCQQLPVDSGHCVWTPIVAGAGRRKQDRAVRVLFMLLHQQGHRLLGQCHLADRVLGFRLRHHQLPVDPGDLLAH